MNVRKDQRQLVFVYGTLMRGFCRHRHLQGQEFVGEARSKPLYRMVHCGTYPGLLHSEPGNSIEGELWAVDAECLHRLDEVEAVAEGLYSRGTISLGPPFDAETVEAYFYRQPVDGFPDCGTRWT